MASRHILILLLPLVWFLLGLASLGSHPSMARLIGGQHHVPSTDRDVVQLAKWAVAQYNSRQGSKLTFVKVIYAKTQVVAGIMYYLTLEAKSQGMIDKYQAKVWVKTWEHFKSLESFQAIPKPKPEDGGKKPGN